MDSFLCEECRGQIPTDEYMKLAIHSEYINGDDTFIQHKTCECPSYCRLEILAETETLKLVRQTVKEEGLSVKNDGK